MTKAVGFDQKIQFNQLDITANFLRHHLGEEKVMYNLLDEHLAGTVKGDASRKKVITMLMKTWNFVEDTIIDLRKIALEEYPYLTHDEKKFMHYCFVCLAYPFFREQVSYIGKQFKQADVIYSRTILSKMKELYGERRRVEVAAGAIFASIKEWEIISMVKAGQYEFHKIEIAMDKPLLQSLLIEVLLKHYDASSLTMETVNNSAIFFPFYYHIGIGDLDKKHFTTFSTLRDTVIERNAQIPYLKLSEGFFWRYVYEYW